MAASATTALESDDLPESDRAFTSLPEPGNFSPDSRASPEPSSRGSAPPISESDFEALFSTPSPERAVSRGPSPTVTELGLQAAPQRPKIITYTARDRKCYSKKTASTNDAAAASDVVSVTSHRPRKVYPPKSRRSGRLRSGRMGDSSPSSMNLQQAIQWGILLLAPSNK
jgi:hypothetical protein